MSQEALEMFSLRELKEIQRVATTTKTKHQFLQLLDQKIAEIEQKTYNDRFLQSRLYWTKTKTINTKKEKQEEQNSSSCFIWHKKNKMLNWK